MLRASRISVRQRADLVIGERVFRMIAGGHRRGRGQRIVLVERRVRHRDGQVVHQVAHHHVAEVHDASHALGLRIDQDVVVVDVSVDDALAERRQTGRHGLAVHGHHALDEAPQGGIADQWQALGDHHGCGGQVPMERAVQGRVIEAGKRPVHHGDRAPQVPEQRIALARRVAEGGALEAGDEAHEVLAVTPDALAVPRRHEGWRQARLRQSAHRQVLGVEHLEDLTRIGHLQHEARTVRPAQEEVLVAFAGEG
jgi:hypothetical protein